LSAQSWIRARFLRYCAGKGSLGVVLLLVLLFFVSPSFAKDDPSETLDQQQVLQFLNKVIGWHQHQAAEQAVDFGPADAAFVNENQPITDQVVQQSFDFARAASQLVSTNQKTTSADSRYESLLQMSSKFQADSNQIQAELQSLRQKLGTASRDQRRILESQIARYNSEYSLRQTQLETLHGILEMVATETPNAGGLKTNIDTLQQTLPASVFDKTVQSPALVQSQSNAQRSSGLLEALSRSLRLSRDLRTIKTKIAQTDDLMQTVRQLETPLRKQLAGMAQQGDNVLSLPESHDLSAVAQQTAAMDALTGRFKLVSAAALPLSKEELVLNTYKTNLLNWYEVRKGQYSDSIQSLIIRSIVLAVLVVVVFGIFELWRRGIMRYVTDLRRRYQFMLLRRIALWCVIAIVIAFTLANQFGSLATFAGLMTAGVAVALQNVILAVVGYFMLIGKYGVSVGDRVQISGVLGEVVDIGLIRLHVMELTGNGIEAQPTGRLVAFANSVVFQTAAGLFRQVPGAGFVWREISLTLAAETDYRAVEQRLMAAVHKAFENSDADFAQLGQQIQASLNSIPIGPLAPKIRFRITSAGLEAVLRFPANLKTANEIDDRITRELLHAIEMEPGLKVVAAEIPAFPLRAKATTNTPA